MARAFAILNATAKRGGGPGAVLSQLNDVLYAGNESIMFVSIFYGVFDIPSGVLTYANAGHNPPFLLRSDRTVEELEMTGDVAVAVRAEISYREKSVDLGPGDTVFCYTDGLTEAKNASMEEFSETNLAAALGDCDHVEVEDIARHVIEKVNEFTDHAPPFDDITCVVVRWEADERISSQDLAAAVTDQLTLNVANDLGQVHVVTEGVEAFGERNKLAADVVFDVKLSIEEMVVNTIYYGYADEKAHTIEVRLDLRGDQLKVRIIDDGKAFDPRDAKEPDTTAALKDRQLGGLGVHLVKNLMDHIEYRREAGRNRLTLTKNLEKQ